MRTRYISRRQLRRITLAWRVALPVGLVLGTWIGYQLAVTLTSALGMVLYLGVRSFFAILALCVMALICMSADERFKRWLAKHE